jgi:long-chain acyl-CoA synthetase
MVAVPPIYRLFIRSKLQGEYDTSSLRIAIAGGGPVTLDLAEAFEQAFGIPLLEGYGLTESACVISAHPPDKNKPGTAGVPLGNVAGSIRKAGSSPTQPGPYGPRDEEGEELAPGQDGEIWVKGPTIMQGYLNRPQETEEVLTPDGWLNTGDIGHLDADGYLAITGRKKELIKTGGENVWPQDVEDVLESHEEVAEATVKAVPDKLRGEVPKAFVVLREGAKVTEAALRDFCRKSLAAYEVPRYIEFRQSLPKGPTGKILKRVL